MKRKKYDCLAKGLNPVVHFLGFACTQVLRWNKVNIMTIIMMMMIMTVIMMMVMGYSRQYDEAVSGFIQHAFSLL